MARANKVRVNSGPKETIILNMNDKTRLLMAIIVGNVMTTAAETRRKAHNKPEI